MVLLNQAISAKTILVVDDKTNNLQLISKYLERENYQVLIAQTGEKAIAIAQALQPDLILLDVMMPGIDGFQTCRMLKTAPETLGIPIIFMTASAEVKNKVEGFKLGAIDYVTKPVEETELLARLDTHLRLHQLYLDSIENAHQRKLLFEIRDRIRQSLDIETILATATTEIKHYLGCCNIGLVTLKEQQIAVKSYAGETPLSQFTQNLSYEYLCSDRQQYNSYLRGKIVVAAQLSTADETQSFQRAIVPIVMREVDYTTGFFSSAEDTIASSNILYGWLVVDRNAGADSWQSSELKLLKEIATQLAIAVKQGLLHEQLSRLALLDSLTRIYNRRFFDRQLKREWRRLKRIPAPLSLIMCDVDCFKAYNDTYGHQQGDKCLQQIAQAIKSVLKRPGDILARYGGEEFAVILPQTPQTGAAEVGEAVRKAVKNLQLPHQNSTVDSVVTLSLGVACTVPNEIDHPQLMIEAADLALYQAKERGRDCVAVYPESISRSKDRQDLKIRWVKRLRQALNSNLFSLYAQSITPLKENDSCKSFEILLRLTDRENKVILPGAFMDVAEKNFLMTDIDTWVVDNLFTTLEKCDRQVWDNYRFSVNLSGASLNNESFLKFLKRRLSECSLPPSLFCFEITESIAVLDLNRVIRFINSLKEIGCSFALDDFGKGVSSLTYLKNLPVDYLKIDGSFIKELDVNPASKVMVEAINHIAEGIGLKTVAEFVENEAILSSVRNLNVDYAQGFHFGLPSALTDIIYQ